MTKEHLQGKTQTSDYLELSSPRKRETLVLGIDKALLLLRLLAGFNTIHLYYVCCQKEKGNLFPAVNFLVACESEYNKTSCHVTSSAISMIFGMYDFQYDIIKYLHSA